MIDLGFNVFTKPSWAMHSVLAAAAILLTAASGYASGDHKYDLVTLLRDARAAVGRESDLARIRSISVTADCVGPKGKYTTSIDSFRVGKTRFSQSFAYKNEPSNVLINGDIVWTVNDQTGKFAISNALQRMVVRAHEYQKMAFDIRSFFSDLTLDSDADFEGRPSVKVRAKNELGMATLLYFDKETRRFSGYVLEIPKSTERVKNVILEWRKVGRLTLPSVVRATDNEGDWTLRFSKMSINTASEKLLDVPPRIADMVEILRMHDLQKTAHLTYNAELLLGNSPEPPVTLSRGNVIRSTRVEDLARFKNYFSSFNFLEWEDIVPPVIRISKDGTMATKIVQKRVRGTRKGDTVEQHTIFAWLEVLEKVEGKWRLTTIASTDKPGDQ